MVAECSGFFGAEQAFFHRLVAHGLQGDAGAIVLNVDGHPAAILAGADSDLAQRRFACGQALLGAFNAVVHRVADEVDDRVGQLVDELAVQLNLGAADLALHLFAHTEAQLAHQARCGL